jgi:hypothetical protein
LKDTIAKNTKKVAGAFAVALAIVLLHPLAALAQAAETAAASPGFWHRLEFSGVAGAAAVKNVGGAFGGELAFPVSDRLELFGEGLWMQDVVSRRRVERTRTVSEYLESSQGKPVSGTVIAPAAYGGGGMRIMLTRQGPVRPYVAFSAGAAHVAYTPEFILAGENVVQALPQYGVTLGRDLTGDVTKFAFGGGGGVRFPRGRWSLDGGVRVLSIRTADQPINVVSVRAALGWKF